MQGGRSRPCADSGYRKDRVETETMTTQLRDVTGEPSRSASYDVSDRIRRVPVKIPGSRERHLQD